MSPIPVSIAAEDALSEEVLRKLMSVANQTYAVGPAYVRSGFGYLRRSIRGFNNAARGTPFLVLTDLDQQVCAPTLIRDWLPVPANENLIFRVAVREVEAWLLADRPGIAGFLGVRVASVPCEVEDIPNPKEALINLARRSRRRSLREDIVPPVRSRRVQGPNYNGRLRSFVGAHWNPRHAASYSPSLARTLAKLDGFAPSWSTPAEDSE